MKVKEAEANTKKLDESKLASVIKELHSLGELIRARQEEKQSIIDEFNSEDRRFLVGKLSSRTIKASIQKTKEELKRLDDEIRQTIKNSQKRLNELDKLISSQNPKRFSVNLSGIKEVKGGKK
jgi:hypothetical protein